MRQGGGGHKEADRQGGRHDKIRPRRDAGEYRRDRGGAFPGTERYRGRHRAYQLPRGGLHREHRPQDTRLPNTDGKLTSRQIAACAAEYYEGGAPEYLTEPKLVYISFPTEQGTLYSKRELRAISEVCKKYGMYLFVDGARMGYGLGAEDNDLTLKDFAELTDVFYIGGTKCGALFGEALIITEPRLQYRFKAYMKQHGAVLAKGWLMGLQFALMLESGEYFERTRRADELAMQIKRAFAAKGIPFWVDSPTNQQFVILTPQQRETLARGYYFEEGAATPRGTVARFCTSWATTQAEVDALLDDIAGL